MISEDLPEPLTPVTQVKVPSGILTVMSLRLWPVARLMTSAGPIVRRYLSGSGMLMRPVR
jgi:hypothetical protein